MSNRTRSQQEGPFPGLTLTRSKHWDGTKFGPWNTVRSFNCDLASSSKTITDVTTPNFRKRIKAGEVINNPMQFDSTSHVVLSPGFAQVDSLTWDGDFGELNFTGAGSLELDVRASNPGREPIPSPIVVSPSVLPELIRSAESQAMANIDKTPFSFGEDIAEFHQTIQFLRDPLSSIRSLVDVMNSKVLQRVGRRRSRSLASAIADVWLTERFAFLPLVRSMDDVIKAYYSKEVIPSRSVARSSVRFEKSVIETQKPDQNIWWDVKTKREIIVRSGVAYETSNPVMDIRRKLGIRNKDLPLIAWQVVPMSFMVDRIFNVSSFIQGFVNIADPALKTHYAFTTIRDSLEFSYSLARFTSVSRGWKVSLTPGKVVDTTFSMSRSPWNPGVLQLLPGFTPGNLVKDASSITDLVSLILQRFPLRV